MQSKAKKFLFDMAKACEAVEKFTAEKSFDDFSNDLLLKSGVERQLHILSEAMYQLDRRFPDVAAEFPDVRKVVGFRHIIVHGYDMVDDAVVWGIVISDLAELKRTILELLDS